MRIWKIILALIQLILGYVQGLIDEDEADQRESGALKPGILPGFALKDAFTASIGNLLRSESRENKQLLKAKLQGLIERLTEGSENGNIDT